MQGIEITLNLIRESARIDEPDRHTRKLALPVQWRRIGAPWYSLETSVLAPTTPLLVGLGRRNLRRRIMSRYREKTSTFIIRLAYILSRKQRPAVGLPPAPQASLSKSPRIGSLDRVLTHYISFSQFVNFQTSLSFPFSRTSPQTHGLLVVICGFALSVRGPTITIGRGHSSYDR